MERSAKKPAKMFFALVGIFIIAVLLYLYTPFRMPCMLNTTTGIPCPGCGLTRATIHAINFEIVDAIAMNILFTPLALVFTAYFTLSAIDIFSRKLHLSRVSRLTNIITSKWGVRIIIALLSISWVYNLIRGI
ncbi:MAG: DUF2752 domain-containing protein [Defluviitaleaceae bacterium]|nr:DUF2752 domain-containing protein [Defluviitaleaceae bacterium]